MLKIFRYVYLIDFLSCKVSMSIVKDSFAFCRVVLFCCTRFVFGFCSCRA